MKTCMALGAMMLSLSIVACDSNDDGSGQIIDLTDGDCRNDMSTCVENQACALVEGDYTCIDINVEEAPAIQAIPDSDDMTGVSTERMETPAPPMISSLAITPEMPTARMGETVQLTLTSADIDYAAEATWTSSDESIATVVAGLVTFVGAGEATISGLYGGAEASVLVETVCNYPTGGTQIGFMEVFPPLVWFNARRPDGTLTRFSMDGFHCRPEFADKEILVVNVGAVWCQPCTRYTQNILNPQAEALLAQGAEILYLEAQDGNYNPASSDVAHRHIDRLIMDGPGYRVGDADAYLRQADGSSLPTPGYVNASPMVNAFPSVWVIRRHDMRLIADQSRSDYYLPLLEIAADPSADWSNPPPPPFYSNCTEEDEERVTVNGIVEELEPNNQPQDAYPIPEPTVASSPDFGGSWSIDGGLCEPASDFYRILPSMPDARWRITLNFAHSEGDLDMTLWDKTTNNCLLGEDGLCINSVSATDFESIEYQGSAYLRIFGYNGASATYTLSYEEL